MKVAVNAKVIKLAKTLKKVGGKLYIVGGYIRNSLLQIDAEDIDVCGSLSLGKLKSALEGSEFSVSEKNVKLGGAKIVGGDFSCDYSTFRSEEYEEGGAHRPSRVRFVDKIENDAKRRDLTVNAIYFDILKGELIDFYDGITDAKKKVLRAIETPEFVFSHDGVRILRLIRLASELNFYIDAKTYLEAEKNVKLLDDISGVRKRQELLLMLASSSKYPGRSKKKAYLKALMRFNSMGIWKYYFLPNVRIKYQMVKKVDEKDRFYGLLIDIVNVIKPRNQEVFLKNLLGEDGFGFSSSETEDITKVILGYLRAVEFQNNKDFFFSYFNYFKTIADILKKKSTSIYKKYNFFYNYLVNNKVAIQTKDLAIKASDIKKFYPKIPARRYSYILEELLSKVFDGVLANDKNSLLKEVDNYDY